MRQFKAIVEYDGTDFGGFQWQNNARSVQSVLEAALQKRTGQPVRVACAGRTDAGVHALGQVISFTAETAIPLDRMGLALNSALPPDVQIRRVNEVESEFHARFSASSRCYYYLILSRKMPSALLRRFTAFTPHRLDTQAMQEAAAGILGERDFASLANELERGRPTYRELMGCDLCLRRGLTIVRVEANAFLRGMVRNLVGTLIEVGIGKRNPESLPDLLASRDRKLAGATAPPQGLCLYRVRYGVRKDYESRFRTEKLEGTE